ncbi:MAG: hypothetical protein ACLFVD_00220 [Dehalococcoidia bacterium]
MQAVNGGGRLSTLCYNETLKIKMTSRRKRRQAERRLAKADRRSPTTIWTIVIIALVVIAVGLARTCR